MAADAATAAPGREGHRRSEAGRRARAFAGTGRVADDVGGEAPASCHSSTRCATSGKTRRSISARCRPTRERRRVAGCRRLRAAPRGRSDGDLRLDAIELAGRLGSSDRLFVANNGVDLAALRPEAPDASRRRWNLPIDSAVLGFIGTLQPYEGLELLIDALPELLRGPKGVHLMITRRRQPGSGAARAGCPTRSRTARDLYRPDRPRRTSATPTPPATVLVYPRRYTETTTT